LTVFSPFEVDLARPGPRVFGLAIAPSLLRAPAFDWLTPEEAERADAMQGKRRRAQFASGRWLLRHAVRRVFGEGNCLVQPSEGKPVVVSGDGLAASASLSHSADLVLCAVGRVESVGVDVERVRPRADWEALAQFALHPRERDRLQGLAQTTRWLGLYQAWTFKEALAKALGLGFFTLPFNRIAISDHGLIEEAPDDERLRAPRWQLRRLSLREGFAAAIAWRA
jgi:4'-phosphopantetheinyl transferase